ncbi:hypothetical protein ADT25_11085 [Xanthomonas oryzae]|uniref:Uncharacterized protein n=2 Tax=Xanthomonas oryzae TaxID=347 RepID=A0AAP0ZKR5_9XANT|nr:hypothetical protein [Xanthomonas oryzae]KOR44292.1 hypothetical protein ADT25_11085 [Xanthomonas oryzae]QBG85830.1 hypothetical protein EYR27_21195 [Xanthomonas oryzae]
MKVDAQSSTDGRPRVVLGTFERWALGIAASVMTTASIALVTTVLQTKSAVDKAATQEAVQKLSEQQAVMNSKLVDIQAQLADVPALKLEVAKQAIQVEQNKQDIKELRQLRGLK